jgi:hypothetical protein
LFPVLAAAFAAPGDEDAAGHHDSAPRLLEHSTLALALASLLLGLAASPVIDLIQIGSPWAQAVVERAAP